MGKTEPSLTPASSGAEHLRLGSSYRWYACSSRKLGHSYRLYHQVVNSRSRCHYLAWKPLDGLRDSQRPQVPTNHSKGAEIIRLRSLFSQEEATNGVHWAEELLCQYFLDSLETAMYLDICDIVVYSLGHSHYGKGSNPTSISMCRFKRGALGVQFRSCDDWCQR